MSSSWKDKYETWEGTAAELAVVAQEVIEAIGMKDLEISPNERLIRHYTQMGVLDRAERKGREAHFGFRQLAQYLVARNLALDGWPLAKIAELTSKSNLPGLLDLIPKPARSRNVFLVNEFTKIEQYTGQQNRRQPNSDDTQRQLYKAMGRLNKKRIIEINLTPWCRVHIDQNTLKNFSPEEADELGKVLAKAIKDELTP